MSTVSQPFGLRPAYSPSGVVRPTAYTIASAYGVNILQNQPVKLGTDGTLQAAAIGDDWPDLPVMQLAAFACAPVNAHAQALAIADHVTAQRGGEGAARAFCDLLLVAGGHYAKLLAHSLR